MFSLCGLMRNFSSLIFVIIVLMVNIGIVSCVPEESTDDIKAKEITDKTRRIVNTDKMYGLVHVDRGGKFTCVTLMCESDALLAETSKTRFKQTTTLHGYLMLPNASSLDSPVNNETVNACDKMPSDASYNKTNETNKSDEMQDNPTDYIIQALTSADFKALANEYVDNYEREIYTDKINDSIHEFKADENHNFIRNIDTDKFRRNNITKFRKQFTPGRKRQKVEIGGRIVGGRDAKPGEVPYIVSLSLFGQIYCGGSLISLQLIISARHCFTDDSLK